MEQSKQIENYRILANNALEANDGEEAVSYFNKIIELDPTEATAWVGKCRAMASRATLAKMNAQATLAAARNGVKFAADDTKEFVRGEAARALTEFGLSCLGASDSHRARFANSASGEFFDDIRASISAQREHSGRMQEVVPCIDYAVELAPSDSTVLRVAIAVAAAAYNSAMQQKYVALMVKVDPNFLAQLSEDNTSYLFGNKDSGFSLDKGFTGTASTAMRVIFIGFPLTLILIVFLSFLFSK